MISLDIRTKERRLMPATLPALNLIAEPGRRRATLDTAREIERRGFAGISVSSSFGNMSQCVGLALATERIPFATAIAPICQLDHPGRLCRGAIRLPQPESQVRSRLPAGGRRIRTPGPPRRRG